MRARPLFRVIRQCLVSSGAALAALVLDPLAASAFCGFYVSSSDAPLVNHATTVALMRDGQRTVLSMQNNYEGPPEGFALVVPVPIVLQKENVKTLPRAIFDKLEKLDAPRLVEYWEEDPCRPPAQPGMITFGNGGGLGSIGKGAAGGGLGVKVEAKFSVGEYDIVILSAKDATGLDTWLRQEKYKIPDGAAPYFKPYVVGGSRFFVAKVNPSKVTFVKGMATLSPLRFFYDTEKFTLPIRLGLVNAAGPQDLIVHILAKHQRYEVANYENVFAPTNFDVDEKARGDFSAFYATVFDAVAAKQPRSVVTEYAWSASSCDPCPTPPLGDQDVLTLGADVAPGGTGQEGSSLSTEYTLTRLHARYTKETLGDDLIFREAKAVAGGREFLSTGGHLEHGALPSQHENNFQARYAVRHAWEGPIACEAPVRGRWGGPPSDPGGRWGRPPSDPGGPPSPRYVPRGLPATDLAFARRGGEVTLASFARSEVPELGLPGRPAGSVGPAPTGAIAPTPLVDDAGVSVDGGTAPPKKAGGCGACSIGAGSSTSRSDAGSAGGSAIAIALAFAGRRRTTRRA